jgi:Carboxypeptidase regulatory-like domain
MTEHLHPGPHLDADQLAAFTEGALSERERQESLVHLSECAACRQIAFLAQEPPPLPVQQPEEVRVPVWQSLRLHWQGFAAVACIVLAAVSLWIWHAQTTVSPTTVAHTSTPPAVTEISPPVENAPLHTPQPTAGDTRPPAPTTPHSKTPHAVAGSPAAPIAAPAAPAVAQGFISKLPLNGGNVTALSPLARAGAAPAADLRELPPADGAIAVRIEHRETTPGGLAEVAGSVQDPSGASIPGATVTLRQSAGSIAGQAKTDQAGRFSIANVPSGQYDLQIAAPGFLSVVRPVELQSSDLALLTSQLPVGAVSQTVNVTSAAPVLETESASIASVLSLPHGKTITASVSQGKRTLALDDAGVLHLSTNGGKHWKTIKPKWAGTVASIRAAETSDGFELTAGDHSVWLSPDGSHWHRR